MPRSASLRGGGATRVRLHPAVSSSGNAKRCFLRENYRDPVHVGIGDRDASTELFCGDSPAANWEVEVRTVATPDGGCDFRGPLVRGKRGDRHIHLNRGTVDRDGGFHLFRRAKVMLSDIPQELIDAAANTGGRLQCRVELTDRKGNPTCARFRPPDTEWWVDHAAAPLSTEA